MGCLCMCIINEVSLCVSVCVYQGEGEGSMECPGFVYPYGVFSIIMTQTFSKICALS